jgi:hypothetical protein
MTIKIDKELILSRIKSHYKFKTDKKFAEFLGLKTTTLANWNKRGTIDFERIFTICEELNPNWIINGTGNPTNNYINLEETEPSTFEDLAHGYRLNSKQQDEVERLKEVINAQEKTIAAQTKTIELMELLIGKKD